MTWLLPTIGGTVTRQGLAAAAIYSPCETYRYALARDLGTDGGACLFVMLNPSTATEIDDDPTIRRCTDYARRWGFGKLFVANFAALRSTNPQALYGHVDPIGSANDAVTLLLASSAARIVVAWGKHATRVSSLRPPWLTRQLARHADVLALGRNGDGSPVHPLYQRADLVPVVYEPRSVM